MISIYIRADRGAGWPTGTYAIRKDDEQLVLHRHKYPYTNLLDTALLTTSAALRSLKSLGYAGADVFMFSDMGLRLLRGETNPSQGTVNVINEIRELEKVLHITYDYEDLTKVKKMCPHRKWFHKASGL